ncbi:MAG: hypothetical protein ACE366_18045 [Bradymonadia bacterium]
MLEFINSTSLTVEEAQFITNLVREQATRLPRSSFFLMSQENILAMLPPGVDLASCEGACEVETGRNIGVDYIISGQIITFGNTLRVVMKLHETRDGTLLASKQAKGNDVLQLEESLLVSAHQLIDVIMPESPPEASAPAPSAPAAPPSPPEPTASEQPAPSPGLAEKVSVDRSIEQRVRAQAKRRKRKKKPHKTFALKGDPLGVMFFGPSFTLEGIPDGTVGWFGRLQLNGSGEAIPAKFGDGLSSAASVLGGAHIYPNDLGHGFYLGLAGGFMNVEWQCTGDCEFVDYTPDPGFYLVLQPELGYRWVVGVFMLDLGAAFNAAIEIDRGRGSVTGVSMETGVGVTF